MATLVMEAVSQLQKSKQKAAVKDIKSSICEKYGSPAEKVIKLVPQYLKKGVNLGIIAKYGDNYRTKTYVARRRRRKSGRSRRRRHRRRHH